MKTSRKNTSRNGHAAPPVFLIGEYQSSTNILSGLLKQRFFIQWEKVSDCVIRYPGNDVEIADLQCAHDLRRLIQSMLNEPAVQRWYGRFKLAVDAETIAANIGMPTPAAVLRAIFCQPHCQSGRSKKVLGERLSECVWPATRILSVFPGAHFIHLIRDGRDAALTSFRQPFSVRNWALAALKWSRHLEQVEHYFRELPADKTLQLRYEDILNQPEEVSRKLTDFLPFGPSAQKLGKAIRESAQPYLKREQPGRWLYDLSEEDIYTFEKIAGHQLRRYGYQTLFPEMPAPKSPAVPILIGNGTGKKIPQIFTTPV